MEHGLLDILFDFRDTRGNLPCLLQVVVDLATILRDGIKAGLLKSSLRSYQPADSFPFEFNL